MVAATGTKLFSWTKQAFIAGLVLDKEFDWKDDDEDEDDDDELFDEQCNKYLSVKLNEVFSGGVPVTRFRLPDKTLLIFITPGDDMDVEEIDVESEDGDTEEFKWWPARPDEDTSL